MLENIKNEIYIQLEMLFAETSTHELTNDMVSYEKNLEKISKIAKILGINTIITKVNFYMNDTDIK